MAKKKSKKSTNSLKLSKPKKLARSVLDRITEPSPDVPRFLVLIQAFAGVGKTSLLATLPGRGLVIDFPQFEGGTSVLHRHGERIKMVPVVSWEELDTLYKYLRKGEHPYEWVAIDTISAASQLARQKVIKERDEIASKGHQLRIQDWGEIGQLMIQMFERFRLLPMPVILLSQERTRKEEDADDEVITRIVPSITPAALDGLVPHPMLIGRLYLHQKDNGKWVRQLRVGPHAQFITKARSIPERPLPDVIRNPHLGNIIAYMMGQDVEPPKKGRETETGLVDLG